MAKNKTKRGSWRSAYNRFREHPFVRFVAFWAMIVVYLGLPYFAWWSHGIHGLKAIMLGYMIAPISAIIYMSWQIVND